jgi:energy-coupling factor transporter ATP-binding protein EcfA2
LGQRAFNFISIPTRRYFKPFEDEAAIWETKLADLDEAMRSLNQVQRRWVYLEPIFGKGSVPYERERFKAVDRQFRSIVGAVAANPSVMALGDIPGVKNVLAGLVGDLERCQKALSQYLEEKRSAFPRFYFIGDDDLLEILGQATRPAVIQTHLRKLFQGVHRVGFDEDETSIVAMVSAAGETVMLDPPVAVTDAVEEWLEDLSKSMVATLRALLVRCAGGTDFDPAAYPSQVLSVSDQIHFTRDCEAVLAGGGSGGEMAARLAAFKKRLQQQLAEYTGIAAAEAVKSAAAAAGAGAAGVSLVALKVKALVMDLIHNIDVVQQLIDAGSTSVDHWQWQKQLRYYMTRENTCIIRMCDARFDYSYEYQGNAGKLVHTPLTDKCYLTLTQAMHLGYGGNPYGPAGTGKTESVKALGGAFGRQVLVFNCDEGIDYKSMGRIFAGLVKCGAWGCFDEFNRLEEEVLSAVSTQIQTIQSALKSRAPSVVLLDKELPVNANAGIFVTLNPAGKGYGGRQKLPDNLKALFRSVSMRAPDNELIAEVILQSEGFVHARDLAAKLVSVFTLSRQLLSAQQHYDWGLRALKTVLRVGGAQIQAARAAGRDVTPREEAEIVIKALRINTLSKLTFADLGRFVPLVEDIFPGVAAQDIVYERLEAAIRATIDEMGLQQLEPQIRKIVQFYEALNQRMGVVIVGPSGCGKTTMWRVLRGALRRIGQTIHSHTFNAKSMPRQQLLGHMDLDTREWFDGVLTRCSREMVAVSGADERSWTIADGDIDPEWVESLNSVLDDNHLLTMPSGERIRFGDNVNFIFETHSLRFASPATVSRMGMIFLSDEDLDTRAIVRSWVADQFGGDKVVRERLALARAQAQAEAQVQANDKENGGTGTSNTDAAADAGAGAAAGAAAGAGAGKEVADPGAPSRARLAKWIDDFFDRALADALALPAPPVETTRVGLVLGGLSHLAGVTTKAAFAVGLIRGLGAGMEEPVRAQFAQKVFALTGERCPDPSRPLDATVRGLDGASLEMYDAGEGDAIPHERLELTSSAPALPVVPTVEVQRNADLVSAWIDQAMPFILCGPQGAGKSMLLNYLFRTVRSLPVAVVHCSASTTGQHVIEKLRQSCTLVSTNHGRVLKPREGERMILLLKDVNLPVPDMYSTIQLVSFLQQVVTYRGYYDESLEFIGIDPARITIVCTMNDPRTVGRHPLSTRFTASVRVASIAQPSGASLERYLSVYAAAALERDLAAG